jgi:carboxypeptidase PM20D1
MVFANLWLFEPVLLRQLERKPATNALVRTTTAPTMLEGSAKENVLPIRARAVVNFRLLPGDTAASVEARVRATIADPRVSLRALGMASEPSPLSRTDTRAYRAIERAIGETSRASTGPTSGSRSSAMPTPCGSTRGS